MKKKTIEERILDIVTYHSIDGTSGWLLDEGRVKKLVDLIGEIVREVIGEDIEYNAGSFRYADEWNKCKQEQRKRARRMGLEIGDGKPVRKKPEKYSWSISKKELAKKLGVKI